MSSLSLTRRQKQILRLIVAGCRNKEIAGRLRIAESTVKSHIRLLFEKLGCTNRVELVQRAHETGLAPSTRHRRAAARIREAARPRARMRLPD